MQLPFIQAAGLRRLAYGAIAGLAVGLVPWPLGGIARGLLGWTAGAGVYLMLAFWLCRTFDAERTRARAQSLDPPNAMILAVMVTAVGACIAAIAMLLQQVKDMTGLERAGHIVLALAALATSWLLIHTVYAFHYAHRYYQQELRDRRLKKADLEPSLDFPGKPDPDYFDFVYFSFVIGMTSQVSDVQVTTSHLRRVTLVHSVLAFAFNMLVLALSVNVVASAI
jgi:uncharacterized membrane protein